MLIKKPNFWDEDKLSIFSIILAPFAFILRIALFFKKKLTTETKYNLPVICVGNIYLGGTGKTPLSIEITKILKKQGKNPVIIKKFYKDHGDEHLLIKHKIKDVIIEKNRKKALIKAIENRYDLAVSDDGLQDFSFYKNLKISCFTNSQWVGNNMTLPSGPLRENLSAVKNHHIVVINCQTNKNKKKIKEELLKINKDLNVYFSRYEVDTKNIDKFKNKKFLAFAGIGNPDNFFNLLKDFNFHIEKKIYYPDHYQYSQDEIEKIISMAEKENLEIITTEKDYFRLKKFDIKIINFLPVNLFIEDKVKFTKNVMKFIK